MIVLRLSEKDFDYELQSLLVSFFPGMRVRVEEMTDTFEGKMTVSVFLGDKDININIDINKTSDVKKIYNLSGEVKVSGEDDWHKKPDKTGHPYRTYYKNKLKKLLFDMIKDIPENIFSESGMAMKIPAWGTMTGVRPTKIPMKKLLEGMSEDNVRKELEREYCCSEEKTSLCMNIAKKEADILRGKVIEDGYSIYVGIPFCPTTCLYCSFPSYPYERYGEMADEYVEALIKEMEGCREMLKGRKLSSVYVGGGTPTALEASQLEKILDKIMSIYVCGQSMEITVEAGRPDSITPAKLEVLKKYDIDRISINPQTMRDETLKLIGRRHTTEDVRKAFLLARSYGFSNINMDLIMGLPGENADDFKYTLEQVECLSPDSITVHSLVVKRASALRQVIEEKSNLKAEDIKDKIMSESFAEMENYAKKHGYSPYYMYRQKNAAGHYGSTGQENIGYARDGKECLYNILIMEELQTILAFGAGASTKWYDREKHIVRRKENVKSIRDYIDRTDEMIERKKSCICGSV